MLFNKLVSTHSPPTPHSSYHSRRHHQRCSHRGVGGRSVGAADPLHGGGEVPPTPQETGADIRGEDGGGGEAGGRGRNRGGDQVSY